MAGSAPSKLLILAISADAALKLRAKATPVALFVMASVRVIAQSMPLKVWICPAL
jgi:hypothetical protein